jgi:hypothetical protein
MREITVIKDGDVVTVEGLRGTFTVGTISGYAAKYREEHKASDRIEAAVRRGHKVVWLNADATVISDPPTPRPEIDAVLRDGEVVRVEASHPEERGYWIVKHPGRMDGDNARLSRPLMVYEVWDATIGKDSYIMLLAEEVHEHVAHMLKDNPKCHISISAHAPNEYTS